MNNQHAETRFDPFEGIFGFFGGLMMEWLNRDMEKKTIELLDLYGNESVLEIGFGPGVGIGILCKKLGKGHVCGVDPSKTMLRLAKRYKTTHEMLELKIATAEYLDWLDCSFDGVCAVNSTQFWDPLSVSLEEVYRVLKPKGKFAVSVHQWSHWKSGLGNPFNEFPIMLRDTGFIEVRAWQNRALSGNALYFSAQRPEGSKNLL